MKKVTYAFSNSSTVFYFDGSFSLLKKHVDQRNCVLITDNNVFQAHGGKFKGWKTIVLNAGEEFKVQRTVDSIIEQLIALQADRKTTLVGVGGGVITDMTGYVASIYMRGISFGFIPTTLLALVDASIGGKNGIDVGVYKNMVGVIRQPSFILHDMALLKTLPRNEWQNGFAEVIKHACIRDTAMFRQLKQHNISYYQKNRTALADLVRRNALIKIRVVQQDEFEKGDRRLLNFGHTLGHALENQYDLLHGQAVAVGMTYASEISARVNGFKGTADVTSLLSQYELPTYANFEKSRVFAVMKMDKKREKKEMNYVLLQKIGKGVVRPIPVDELEKMISSIS